jgi:hypothetical protein
VTKQRDNLLISGGILIGLGLGLLGGVVLFLFSVATMLHHMFILGVQWSRLSLLLVPPLLLMTFGLVLLRNARRLA